LARFLIYQFAGVGKPIFHWDNRAISAHSLVSLDSQGFIAFSCIMCADIAQNAKSMGMRDKNIDCL